jgi:2-hydroxy-3-keto-5-methylthiopentenyl-1-phosphate phosphatase
MTPLDLSSTTVFLDFDGTITQHDSAVHLLNRTAGDSWRAVEDLWLSGAIGSRECLQRQWELIPSRNEQELRRIVREVPVDPGFRPLVHALRTSGAEIVVLSDGYGFYAEEVCQPEALTLISNHIDWESWSVTFPAISASCDCPGCGTCKPAAIRAANRAGHTTVLVGDGASDRRGAVAADHIFATAALAEWCRATGLQYQPFVSLADVMEALVTRSYTPDR